MGNQEINEKEWVAKFSNSSAQKAHQELTTASSG
jgi:hypothetical protein